MKIIIVGIGKVGYTVAEQLVSEKHDITLIDTSREALSNALADMDINCINGNGASKEVLQEAGIEDCDMLIALTGSDEVNLLCCLLGKKLGAAGTIARVRNPEYHESLELVKDTLGLSMAVNPEREAAGEIYRILKFPTAINVDIFAKGKIDLISFEVKKDCTLCGKTVRESFSELTQNILACAVERESGVYIPSGNFVIEENDKIITLAPPDDISSFFKAIGYPVKTVKNVMIIGGGRIAHYLASLLTEFKLNTTIVEQNKEVAENLSLLLPGASIICGDGTNRSLLMEEGLENMDALCSLTGFDEENILLSLYAKNAVPSIKTVTKVNKMAFQEVVDSMDLGSVIYPKYTTADLILQHVRARQNNVGSGVETLYKLINNQVEALEFHVGGDSKLIGKTLQELPLKEHVLIGCINRQGRVFIPHGQDRLLADDTVVVVTKLTGLSDLDSIIED